MNEIQGNKGATARNEPSNSTHERVRAAKKAYEAPELTVLGDVAELTNYDVSVIV